AGTAAAALVVAGLSFAGGSTAAADPYAGAIKTNCKVSVQSIAKKKLTVKALIKTNAVTGNVKGARTVQLVNKKGKVVREITLKGGNNKAVFKIKKKRAKKMTVVVSGTPKNIRF